MALMLWHPWEPDRKLSIILWLCLYMKNTIFSLGWWVVRLVISVATSN